MREAIGTETIFKAVLVFTLIFAAFVAVAITYNKAYKMKNETMFILEKYEGINDNSLRIINNYLRNNGYKTKGICDAGDYGINSLEETSYVTASGSDSFYYCLKPNEKSGKTFITIKVFFRFSLPFFGDLFTFKVTGETKGIRNF